MLHQVADRPEKFLISVSVVDHAVFSVADQIGHRSRFPAGHHGAPAVHGLVDHRSPSLQMIAGEQKNMTFLHRPAHPGRGKKARHFHPFRKLLPAKLLSELFLQLSAADQLQPEVKALPPQIRRKPQGEFRVLQLHQPSGPEKADGSVLGLFLLPPRLLRLRKVAEAQHFSRIGVDQRKIGGNIRPRAEQIDRPVPVADMLPVFCRKPSGRHRLPLSLPVDPLTDAKGRSSAFQALIDQLRIFHPAGEQQIAAVDPIPAQLLLFIQKLHIGEAGQTFSPAHAGSFLLHGLRLDKGKILSQPPVKSVAEGNLMVVDIIGYKGCFHALSSRISR